MLLWWQVEATTLTSLEWRYSAKTIKYTGVQQNLFNYGAETGQEPLWHMLTSIRQTLSRSQRNGGQANGWWFCFRWRWRRLWGCLVGMKHLSALRRTLQMAVMSREAIASEPARKTQRQRRRGKDPNTDGWRDGEWLAERDTEIEDTEPCGVLK